jgi:hypothetical protein
MQATVIATRIVEALRDDHGPGYDLEAGMFGPALSAFIRELAEATLTPAQPPIGDVQIEYKYADEPNDVWCDLGPGERMRADFKGIYRLKAGVYPVAAAPISDVPAELHPATADLVKRFAAALAQKLAAAEKKYGYSDAWASPDWMDKCRADLLRHVRKGDPRDVAAYCAFLWHHGERTAAPIGDVQLSDEEVLAVVDRCFGKSHYAVDNKAWVKFARALSAPRERQEPAWQPIATAPRAGSNILIQFRQRQEPVTSEMRGGMTHCTPREVHRARTYGITMEEKAISSGR